MIRRQILFGIDEVNDGLVYLLSEKSKTYCINERKTGNIFKSTVADLEKAVPVWRYRRIESLTNDFNKTKTKGGRTYVKLPKNHNTLPKNQNR